MFCGEKMLSLALASEIQLRSDVARCPRARTQILSKFPSERYTGGRFAREKTVSTTRQENSQNKPRKVETERALNAVQCFWPK